MREELESLKEDYKRVNEELKINEADRESLINEHKEEIKRVREEASSEAQKNLSLNEEKDKEVSD